MPASPLCSPTEHTGYKNKKTRLMARKGFLRSFLNHAAGLNAV
ncbi:hypothetical protein AmDm5_1610 [Acetobacter malorum]|nr:hypothetical protein AmDm5_1610 [Acetobacter malorum]